ncbi:IS1181 transposase [Staphylococcus schleiferi]|uniref:IS1181 transposase n=2 Tax=Staphylococcus schleiferi TaxID=1295 RepID=A0A7Z7VWY6_STASC|nr:transposase family protein [Staphylococcus schleiferi]CAD7358829.1 IS1181 transposase [Staphylococcus schleiferi]SUM86865.1 IS1181 transposase [Staphylococcus schleiferi]
MCNDILKLLKIKDNNIKITKVEEDVVIRGKKSNVIFGTLSYKPMTCPHCYHSNPNRIHKHGKRLSRITFLRFQEIAVYLNPLKQRFKCRVCGRTFTSKTNVVEDNCFISNHVQKAIIDKATQVRSETDIASDCNVSASSVKRVIHKVSNATFQ